MEFSIGQVQQIATEVARQMLQQADQTETIRIPSGTGAGVVTKDFTLDARFKKCNGVVAYSIKSQAGLNYRIGIRDNNRPYVQRTSYKHISASEQTPANNRYKGVDIPAAGAKVYVEVETFEALTSDLEFDIVFSLIEPNR